jgi:hypothetical protein
MEGWTMGGVIKSVSNIAKTVVDAPLKAASTIGKLGIEAIALPTTITSKALASIAPGVFGPLDQKFSQLKGLAKMPFDLAEKAGTKVNDTIIDKVSDHEAHMVDMPLKLAGGVLGVKPPFMAN